MIWPSRLSEVAVTKSNVAQYNRLLDAVDASTAVNVLAYGAAGNGSADDTAEIQAALDAARPNSGPIAAGSFTTAKAIYLPRGVYLVSAPLRFYSGQSIIGDGRSTVILAAGDFSGSALLKGKAATGNQVAGATVASLAFQSALSGVAAVGYDTATDLLLNCELRDLYLNTAEGLLLDGYTQHCKVSRIYSWGPINRLLYLKGNHNLIDGIDKEVGTGSSDAPYVEIEAHGHAGGGSGGNVLRNLLLEGTGHVNKVPLRLNGAPGTVVENLWVETTTTNGYAVDIADSPGVRFEGNIRLGTVSTSKLKVRESTVAVSRLDVSSSDVPFVSYLDVDSASRVSIATLRSRRGQNVASFSASNVTIEQTENAQMDADAPAGWLATVAAARLSGPNLLANPSFEAGAFGWTTVGGGTLSADEYIAAEMGGGLMRRWTANAASTTYTYQSLSIGSAEVGLPVTVCARVKVTGGTAKAIPYAFGAGVGGPTGYQAAVAGAGWCVISQTVVPQEAGTLQVGVRWVDAASGNTCCIDDVSVHFGIAESSAHSSATYTLGGKTFTVASAAPTTGTWRAGDVVFASNYPTKYGWICAVAGTPGTWAEMRDPTEVGGGGGGIDGITIRTGGEDVAANVTTLSINPGNGGNLYLTDAGGGQVNIQIGTDSSYIQKIVQYGSHNLLKPDSASGTAYRADILPAITMMPKVGSMWLLVPDVNNVGACTLNIHTTGEQPLKRADGSDLSADELVTGRMYPVWWDGTVYRLLQASASGGAVSWGGIGGTLSDQADLSAAFAAKKDYAVVSPGIDDLDDPDNPNDIYYFGDSTTGVKPPGANYGHVIVARETASSGVIQIAAGILSDTFAFRRYTDEWSAWQVLTTKAYVDSGLSGKAASSHTHTVSGISATGTASTSTFLRGDGSWQRPAISALSGVNLSGVTDGQVLAYNSGVALWVPTTPSGGGASGLADLDDVTLTTPANGQTLIYASGDWVNKPTFIEPGLFSARPAANTVAPGTIYAATDVSYKHWISNGTDWRAYFQGHSVVEPPLASNWIAFGNGAWDLSDEGGYLKCKSTMGSTVKRNFFVLPLPVGTNWTVETELLVYIGSGSTPAHAGLALVNSTDPVTDSATFGYRAVAAYHGNQSRQYGINVFSASDLTTAATTAQGFMGDLSAVTTTNSHRFRIRRTSSWYIFESTVNGHSWDMTYSWGGAGTGSNPTHIGIYTSHAQAAGYERNEIHVVNWRVS